MALLLDRSISAGTVHVLIIGVGSHENDALDPLVGMDQAMRKNCEWWVKEGPNRRLPKWEFGTVEALAASESAGQLVVGTSSGNEIELEIPTVKNVQSALLGWLKRVESGGFGILHWAGHGAFVGMEGDGPAQALYCQDSDGDAPCGINWQQAVRCIRSLSGDARVCCFIDACRSKPKFENWEYATIAGNFKLRPMSRSPMIIYTTSEGSNSYSYKKEISGADFSGGPLGSHSIFDAFNIFAARGGRQTECNGIEYTVTPFDMLDAIQRRMKRIGLHIGFGPDWEPCCTQAIWKWGGAEPILTAPTPHCMLDVRLPQGRDYKQTKCTVSPVGGATAASSRISPIGAFEFSPPYGEYEVRIGDSPPSELLLRTVWHEFIVGEAR